MEPDERKVSRDLVIKFGTTWAVLTAMTVDCAKRGAHISPEVQRQLALARMKIESGCFSPCELGCLLDKVERELMSASSVLGEEYLRPWCDLLGQAMEGGIGPRRISGIPALASIVADCEFLAGRGGEATSPSES